MAIKLEVVVKRGGNGVDINVSCSDDGFVGDSESAYMVGLMEVINAFNADLDKPTPGCNCTVCRKNRKKKHGCSNLH